MSAAIQGPSIGPCQPPLECCQRERLDWHNQHLECYRQEQDEHPNKSTCTEEVIKVPYNCSAHESGSTANEEPYLDEMEGGPSTLTCRLSSIDENAGGCGGGNDYYDKMLLGPTPVSSDRSLKNGRTSISACKKMNHDCEAKNTTMQSRIAGFQELG